MAAVALVLAACGGGGNGGGEVHPLGQEAVVGYNEPTSTGQRGPRVEIAITVLAVRTGTQQELSENGLEVDPEDQDTIPFYVDARFENRGANAVTRNLDMSLEDSDGNLIGNTLIFDYGGEPFEPCPRVTEGTLAPGESYESCTLFLVPEGVDVGNVSFLSDNGPNQEPEFVYWASE
jgi:hypothetical protein